MAGGNEFVCSGAGGGAVACPSSRAKILSFTEGNEAFARQIVGEFLKLTPPLLADIKEALKLNDRESIKGYCHRMKGNLSYLGEERILEIVSGINCNAVTSEELEPFFTEMNAMLGRLAREWNLASPCLSAGAPQPD